MGGESSKRSRQNRRTAKAVRQRRRLFAEWCRMRISELRAAGEDKKAARIQGHLDRQHNSTKRWL
jgi:hypothetical protein